MKGWFLFMFGAFIEAARIQMAKPQVEKSEIRIKCALENRCTYVTLNLQHLLSIPKQPVNLLD